MKRIVLGGLFGGIAVFVFSAVTPMALPSGHPGLKSLPAEEAVMAAMRAGIPEEPCAFAELTDQAGGSLAGGLVIAPIYRSK